MGVFFNLAIVILIPLLALYLYIQWKLTYWQRRGLPYHKSTFIFGLRKFQNQNETIHFTAFIKEPYDFFKSRGHEHFGITIGITPVYVPIHPELIKNIMVRDFSYFPDRGLYYNEKDDPLNVNLLSLEGQKWKDMREKLSPIFSASKIKMLFECVLNCGNRMITMMDTLSKNGKPVDMKEITSCYTTDVGSACVFGIDSNSCEDNQNEFRKHARTFFTPLTMFQIIQWAIAAYNNKLGRFLRISISPRDMTKFFLNIVQDNVQFREKNKFFRSDIMQLLIELKNKEGRDRKKPNLSILELTAHSFLFFNATIQSSASTVTFCLYELTKNLQIQEKLRNEINDVIDKHEGQITYDNIMEMKYLHQVFEETLRMYPSLYATSRQCSKNYHVPNSNVIIEKGTQVFFPISALHRDADFFPDPDKFDPERFNKINKPTMQPFTYLPFGEGPKFCIASRFGDIQVKVGIAVLLRHFRFTLNEQSSAIKLDPYMPMLAFEGPAWFNIEKI